MHGLATVYSMTAYTNLEHIVKTSQAIEWTVLITGKSFSSYLEAERLLLYVRVHACVWIIT